MQKINLLNNEKMIDSSVEEYYNTIRTNIQFLGTDKQVIAITSTKENEGKSTVAVNLAISMAKLGLKTILIDADTRKSVMAGRFKIKTKTGLSNYLSGISKIEDVINETDVENLHLIPAGQIPPNPTLLLQNNNFKTIIDVFREYYDYIIIDTPPLGLVVDATIIARKCDGVIMVVGSGDVKYKDFQKTTEQLEKNGNKLLGVVLNKYDTKMSSYGQYGNYAKK